MSIYYIFIQTTKLVFLSVHVSLNLAFVVVVNIFHAGIAAIFISVPHLILENAILGH